MTTLVAKKFSVQEYLFLDQSAKEKHEFFKGEVFRMDGETVEHNAIVSNIIIAIGGFTKVSNFDVFPSCFRISTSDSQGFFCPDVTIVFGPIDVQPGMHDSLLNPTVIFEVMSESTVKSDMGYKFFCYRKVPSLQEYVLVDSRDYSIEVIRRQSDGAWRIEKYSPSDKNVHLVSISCKISFDDIYYRAQFPQHNSQA